VHALAESVDVQIRSRDPASQLAGALSRRSAPLLIDNCEHVVDEVAE
jgi:hypothetical protein